MVLCGLSGLHGPVLCAGVFGVTRGGADAGPGASRGGAALPHAGLPHQALRSPQADLGALPPGRSPDRNGPQWY